MQQIKIRDSNLFFCIIQKLVCVVKMVGEVEGSFIYHLSIHVNSVPYLLMLTCFPPKPLLSPNLLPTTISISCIWLAYSILLISEENAASSV